MKDEVIALPDGFYAVVNGKLYGPWPMREYAEAGLKTEQRRKPREICECGHLNSNHHSDDDAMVAEVWCNGGSPENICECTQFKPRPPEETPDPRVEQNVVGKDAEGGLI